MTDAQEKKPEPGGSSGDESLALLGSATGGLGGALAAGFAALCCVGPSTVALLGVGGALAAASLEPYRPYLLLGSLAMILYGFWRVYSTNARGPEGAACPTRAGRIARNVLWVAAIVWVIAIFLPRINQ